MQQPVIDWARSVLTADRTSFFRRYWFGSYPWDDPAAWQARWPLSLVGNVKTPTMVLTGESDYRAPMSESEQYFMALRPRKVPTALVRVPGASHELDARPSLLASKAAHVLAWFQRHGGNAAPQ